MKRLQISQSFSAFVFGVPALLWQIIFFYIPLFFLLSFGFISYNQETGVASLTLSHYKQFFEPVFVTIIMRSFLLASLTVVATLVIAYPVAYYLSLKIKKWKTFFFALIILPFWTNFLLLVYAWYFLLENDGIINTFLRYLGFIHEPLHMINTPLAVMCGMLYCYLPFMLLPLYSTFERFDTRFVDASRDLGATRWQTFLHITLPLTLPGIQTGALLVFIPAFGEFVIPALLGGDKTMYIGSIITHYFLTVRDSSLGSAFTCFTAFILLLLLSMLAFFLYLLSKRKVNG